MWSTSIESDSFVSFLMSFAFCSVQVRLDDRSQLVVVTLELLRVHQQVVSEFGWRIAQHHADYDIVIQL